MLQQESGPLEARSQGSNDTTSNCAGGQDRDGQVEGRKLDAGGRCKEGVGGAACCQQSRASLLACIAAVRLVSRGARILEAGPDDDDRCQTKGTGLPALGRQRPQDAESAPLMISPVISRIGPAATLTKPILSLPFLTQTSWQQWACKVGRRLNACFAILDRTPETGQISDLQSLLIILGNQNAHSFG